MLLGVLGLQHSPGAQFSMCVVMQQASPATCEVGWLAGWLVACACRMHVLFICFNLFHAPSIIATAFLPTWGPLRPIHVLLPVAVHGAQQACLSAFFVCCS
jgi:hypothetical protein